MSFPNLPGVPALSNLNPNVVAGVTTYLSPLISNLLDKLKPKWGIYDETGTNEVLHPDSFLSLMYHNESNLPMFPIEDGAFSTYNKVPNPFDITVRVTKSNTIGLGTGLARQSMNEFLKFLEGMIGDTNLYSVLTPDFTYINANLKGFDYKREMNNGAAIILADLHFVEIMRASVSVTSANGSPDPYGGSSTCAATPVAGGFCTPTNVSGTTLAQKIAGFN